jgi:glycerate kinase
VPIGDGGEGTLEALLAAMGGERRSVDVTGPLGQRVRAAFGVIERDRRRIAVVEIAAASGLQLPTAGRSDPVRASTFGTGELIRAALREGVDEILVGVGGSATNDGGVGMAQALGVRFLDADRRPVGGGARAILDVASIDVGGLDPAVARTRIVAATDVDSPLTGPAGASAVFGPQKGASPEDVALLDRALVHLAAVIARDLGIDVRDLRGAGAAGGLGAGLVAFLGARMRRGAEVVMDAVGFDPRLEAADAVVTGEGRLDASSLRGKVVGAVLERAARARVRATILCGEADPGVSPAGADVHTLVAAVGRERAVEEPRRALEELASRVAAAT